ncbi:MAG: glucose-1-phosphate adenylyltransferase [Anaerolineaceae bacterium]|nr:glucose-1-phosphate adenylyltransferase [Anaerolineaceae bacterium]
MKLRVVILAGGEGTRLGVLTAKRTKPAVPFGGKYRIIDFPLSNCVNSNLFDIMIVAQYRPHSLVEHIGSGAPWDLNRDFTGGVRILTPYKSRASSWFAGTADALQQNFSFIKSGKPDLLLVLSGDHIYTMDYARMINYHLEKGADLTMATIQVPLEEASRFGIVGIDGENRVNAFVEKPANPPSTLANMGVYLFNFKMLDSALWEDHICPDSSHDFGKDIIPKMVAKGERIYAYPYGSYWVDVGTVESYWQAHMDMLGDEPRLDLNNRDWIIHTRTEERPPVKIKHGAKIENSLICDGSFIERGTIVSNSILSPGVRVKTGAVIRDSIILTDCVIGNNTIIDRAILDKRAQIHTGATVGGRASGELSITMVGKNSIVPENALIHMGASVGQDVVPSDYLSIEVGVGERVQTRRPANEL